MSYKDGIPLLASFADDVDDDDLTFQNVRPPGKCRRCSKRTVMFSIVLGVAIALSIALIVGVTVPVLVIPNAGSGIKPHTGDHSDESNATSSLSVAPSLSTATMTIVNTSSVHVVQSTVHESLSVSSTPQPVMPSPVPTSVPLTPSPSSALKMSSLSTSSVMMAVSSSLGVATSSQSMNIPISSSPGVAVSSLSPTPALTASSSVPISSSSSPIVSHTPSSSLITTLYLTASYVMSTSAVVTPTPSVTPLPVNNENCTVDSLVCPSKLDDRKYRVMTLNNSLRVLLISDPNSNISAAAMDIPAGSFNDPPDYEGLAHFCEHMLFIGTKKYPETNQYSHFLQSHGGGDNAFTSTQNTNYFFNVEAEYFSTALDMFAHFFIDPLFSVGSVMDEMNAVNAEHQKNLHTDGWKLWQLLKNVSNPQHPFSQFSTGSLETLNKSDIHDQLLQYFNSSYSANTVS